MCSRWFWRGCVPCRLCGSSSGWCLKVLWWGLRNGSHVCSEPIPCELSNVQPSASWRVLGSAWGWRGRSHSASWPRIWLCFLYCSDAFAKLLESGDLHMSSIKVDGISISFQHLLAKICFHHHFSGGSFAEPSAKLHVLKSCCVFGECEWIGESWFWVLYCFCILKMSSARLSVALQQKVLFLEAKQSSSSESKL